MKRQCITCHEFKENGEFPTAKSRKGKRVRRNQCKVCLAKYKRSHYDNQIDKYKARAKSHRENDPNIKEKRREYYEANKEELLEKQRIYQKENRELYNSISRKYRENPINKIKESARNQVNKGIKYGRITKPEFCEDCGKDEFLEAHHEDYSKPLEVKWLCKTCHWKQHSKR